ncbi:MAG: hypothetical protein F6K49_36200 [Moorea sp. SIO3I6]|nr:hypothetical protein [Moorena sp. SIO3I6]
MGILEKEPGDMNGYYIFVALNERPEEVEEKIKSSGVQSYIYSYHYIVTERVENTIAKLHNFLRNRKTVLKGVECFRLHFYELSRVRKVMDKHDRSTWWKPIVSVTNSCIEYITRDIIKSAGVLCMVGLFLTLSYHSISKNLAERKYYDYYKIAMNIFTNQEIIYQPEDYGKISKNYSKWGEVNSSKGDLCLASYGYHMANAAYLAEFMLKLHNDPHGAKDIFVSKKEEINDVHWMCINRLIEFHKSVGFEG